MDNWEKIFVTEQGPKAELARNVLENHQIQAVMFNKKDSSFQFGLFEIYVPSEKSALAKQLLNNEVTD